MIRPPPTEPGPPLPFPLSLSSPPPSLPLQRVTDHADNVSRGPIQQLCRARSAQSRARPSCQEEEEEQQSIEDHQYAYEGFGMSFLFHTWRYVLHVVLTAELTCT